MPNTTIDDNNPAYDSMTMYEWESLPAPHSVNLNLLHTKPIESIEPLKTIEHSRSIYVIDDKKKGIGRRES